MRKNYGDDEVSIEDFESFNPKEAVVWVDPLDGTNDFVKGNLSAVTVLIGLAINTKSRLGVVHNPFTEEDASVGKTMFGSAEHGVFSLVYNKNMTVEETTRRHPFYMEPFEDKELATDHEIRVAASLSHFSPQIKEIIETLEPVKIVRLGGAGNKCCNLAISTVDAYIHPSPGLMFWDLCAPESLVKGMGGWATDLHQRRLSYPVNAENYKLAGLILARHPPMYNEIKRRMGELLINIGKKVKL